MDEQLPKPARDILQKMPDGIDLLYSKTIGKIVMEEFEHDDFIDSLDKSIKYPKDAP